jgi:hypothetical protein
LGRRSAIARGMTWLYISILRAFMSNLPLSLAQYQADRAEAPMASATCWPSRSSTSAIQHLGFQRHPVACKYRNAVPALLAVPDCPVTGFPKLALGEFVVRCLQLLQAGDVRPGFGEPAHQLAEGDLRAQRQGPGGPSSLLTLCWREQDSNPRSPGYSGARWLGRAFAAGRPDVQAGGQAGPR